MSRTSVKYIWLVALAPLLAFQTVRASACRVVGHSSSGEPLCMTTSDGAGQPYTNGRYPRYPTNFAQLAQRRRIEAVKPVGGLLDWLTKMHGH
jgi:hypothetical protein